MRERVFAEEELPYDRDATGTDENGRTGTDARRPTIAERDTLHFGHMLDAAREAIDIARGADDTRFEEERL